MDSWTHWLIHSWMEERGHPPPGGRRTWGGEIANYVCSRNDGIWIKSPWIMFRTKYRKSLIIKLFYNNCDEWSRVNESFEFETLNKWFKHFWERESPSCPLKRLKTGAWGNNKSNKRRSFNIVYQSISDWNLRTRIINNNNGQSLASPKSLD